MPRTYLMTLSLSLSPEAVNRLGDRGRAAGKTANRVAAEIVLRELGELAREDGSAETPGGLRAVNAKLRADNERLWEENAELRRRPPRSFDRLGADRLADEVAVLVHRKWLDARSPAADALLDYRDPPSTPRADRMAKLEGQVLQLEAKIARLEAAVSGEGGGGPETSGAGAEPSESAEPT